MKFQIGSFVNHGKKKKKHVFVYYTCMNACIKIHFVTKKLQNKRLVLLTHVLKNIGLVIVTSPGPRLV